MNTTPPTNTASLRSLMIEDDNREVECQPFLQFAHPILTPPLSRVVQVVREQVAMSGRSDYFLLCEVQEVELRRRLILWEAKAPQLPPFQISTDNRLAPTRALVEAENQLIYYYDEYRSNGQFLDRYRIRHPDDVRLGGIVIGRDDNLVRRPRGDATPDEVLTQLVSSALRIRNEHFYHDRIRLMTWDRIASVVERPPAQSQERVVN